MYLDLLILEFSLMQQWISFHHSGGYSGRKEMNEEYSGSGCYGNKWYLFLMIKHWSKCFSFFKIQENRYWLLFYTFWTNNLQCYPCVQSLFALSQETKNYCQLHNKVYNLFLDSCLKMKTLSLNPSVDLKTTVSRERWHEKNFSQIIRFSHWF